MPKRKVMASCSSIGERSCRSKAVNRAVEVRMVCSDLRGEGLGVNGGSGAKPSLFSFHCCLTYL